MKKVVMTSLMLILVASFGIQAQEQEKKSDKKDKKVEQMTCWASLDCESCKAKVEKNIAFEKGVKELKVDLESKLVTISYRTDKTSPEKLEKAIQDLGYKTEIIPAKKQEEKKK